MKEDKSKPRVVIAGASGFVGRRLLKYLAATYEVIGLSRMPFNDEFIWRQCDLYSLRGAEEALDGADYAIYLVHSMMPSARLTQGNFEDMDLILADNFSRAAKKAGVKQIIYLGDIIPDANELSIHLRSRLEVEETLGAHGVPVTALRAALIVGQDGPTFNILIETIKRLPLMTFSSWQRSLIQPIALTDVVPILKYCIGNEGTYNQSFDIGGPDILTYSQLLKTTAEIMGYKRRIFRNPFFSVGLARYLLSIITGAPMALVYPLVESLQFDLVAKDLRLQRQLGLRGLTFSEAVKISLKDSNKQLTKKYAIKKRRITNKAILNVRSVQRLPLPKNKDADWAARYYADWLPKFFGSLIKVKVDEFGNISFYLRFMAKPLLELTFSSERSSKDRPLYYITGGLLAKPFNKNRRGRLEFRQVLKGKYVLAAIHDFVPALPWFFYSLTQAPIHLWVMNSYGRHLAKLIKEKGSEYNHVRI
ncbi:MAG: NAD-dependent epimerase/dehydratase family protein [Bacillota bacterium]|nr:NAD-dependent epimerase/dehydratase family protein [Bacillota bacterium]